MSSGTNFPPPCSATKPQRPSLPFPRMMNERSSPLIRSPRPIRCSSKTSTSACDGKYKYDVFINFRGAELRKGFISHLYASLFRNGIETFIDSEKLKAGKEISPELYDAIERSKIAIVVFSKEYASSKWCLRELVKIMECRKTRGQIVLPVFLGVEPTEVRWQKGSYAAAFARHDEAPEGSELAEEVKGWRKAMSEAANISGLVSSAVGHDNKLVNEIVAHVLKNLENISLCEEEGLVGAYHQVKEVEKLLEYGSDEVRTIGICGAGGNGKTAIAGTVFNRQYQKFDSYCFLPNVREQSEKHGLFALRNELLRQILDQSDINITTPDIGSTIIKNHLRRKRVLIVLDDVCSITQLEFLIKQSTCFAPGSRIVITTRDMNVIKNADKIYPVQGLSDSDSLELFSRCAFKQSYPPEEYLQLSMRAAVYAKGSPLALKVLGSFLCKKTVLEWESALTRLDSSLDEEIFSVFRISYDGLNDEERMLFLHLACFFNGEQKSYVSGLMEGCGISVDIGMRALVDKCMITFTDDKLERLQMHDLVRNMGRQIEKQQSPQDPSKRSRLWSFDEGHEVLAENTGTISTEGISLDLSEKEVLHLDRHAFSRMSNLKLLRFSYKQSNEESCKVHLPEGLDYLPPKLCLLSWDNFPLENLPESFIPEKLVELHIPNSKLYRLWEGVKSLSSLKGIDLSNSRFLKELPDLSDAPKVERIVARGCVDLVTIPTPRNKWKSLEHLDLSGCLKLKDFPEISWNIKKLFLGYSRIEEIPPAIANFHQLVHLDMKMCKMLKKIAQIGQILEKLEYVDLSGCSSVTSFPDISCNLKKLLLNETSIEDIPSRIKCMTKLELLELKNCLRLKNLPSSICELESLVELNLSGSSNFSNFPEITKTMDSLKYLSLNGSAIKELPSSLENLTGLISLDLENCNSLISLPEGLSKLKFLEDLSISGCSSLDNLPGCIRNLGFLVNVRASGCRSEVVVEFLRSGSSSLKILDLSDWDCGVSRGFNTFFDTDRARYEPKLFQHNTSKHQGASRAQKSRFKPLPGASIYIRGPSWSDKA